MPWYMWLLIGVAAGSLSLLAGRLVRVGYRAHLERVVGEKAFGNMWLRNRMQIHLGRRYDVIDRVTRAETMYGWVWIAMTRHAPDPIVNRIGWSPFKWTAKRAAYRYRAARRADDERGSISDMILMLFLVLLAASFLSHVVADLTVADVRDWLLGIIGHVWGALFG